MVITVSGEKKVKKLYVLRPQFGGIVKIVEKYWESTLSLVYMTYCRIDYERMGKYRN